MDQNCLVGKYQIWNDLTIAIQKTPKLIGIGIVYVYFRFCCQILQKISSVISKSHSLDKKQRSDGIYDQSIFG